MHVCPVVSHYFLHTLSVAQFPVFFRFVGYDRLFGSHYDEYIIEYNTFSSDNVDTSPFDVVKSELLTYLMVVDIKFDDWAKNGHSSNM